MHKREAPPNQKLQKEAVILPANRSFPRCLDSEPLENGHISNTLHVHEKNPNPIVSFTLHTVCGVRLNLIYSVCIGTAQSHCLI